MTVYGYKTVGTLMKGERSDEKPLVIVSKMKMGKKIIATKSVKPVGIKPLAGKIWQMCTTSDAYLALQCF